MHGENRLIRRWVVTGVVAGILGDLAYASAVAPVPLPDTWRMYLGFSFGPLIAVAFVGFYHFFKLHRNTVSLQLATLFGIIAGTVVNLMIVVQSAVSQSVPADASAEMTPVFEVINMVQLGLDVSWDIFFSVSMLLFGLQMFGHPRFGWFWGVPAILIAGGLLALNLATFPIPPAEAGAFDLGPVSGVFYLLLSLRIWRSLRWVDRNLHT